MVDELRALLIERNAPLMEDSLTITSPAVAAAVGVPSGNVWFLSVPTSHESYEYGQLPSRVAP